MWKAKLDTVAFIRRFMVSALTLMSQALFAWGAVVALAAVPLATHWVAIPMATFGAAAATGGLVLGIIGAARHEGF